jgi:hypothetical protein
MQRIAILLSLGLAATLPETEKFRPDDPLDSELKPLPVTDPARRKLSDYYDAITHTLSTPGEFTAGDAKKGGAQAINTLGEPLQGAWWVKRHYYRPMTVEQLVAGPGNAHPPSAESSWTVIGAKNEGVTPGFVMSDAKGELYFMKFDPLSNPEMATGADHIAIRLVHALGYHVPENYLVEFTREQLVIGKDVSIADRLGRRHKMTERDLSELLLKVPKMKSGKYRATASRAIPGKGLGPYRYYGRRSDDPNDFVPHEHRRDLRGLAVVSAWIDHDDSRAINTYDALIDGSIRHYILDLGSALGSGTQQANSPRSGGEYLFGWKQSAVQLFTLGAAIPYWAHADFPDLPSVGRFEWKTFDPAKWVPEYPNPAFRNRLPDDEFWAAKQIVALRDNEIEAIVQSAQYSDPKAAAWITRCLIERRDKIGRTYLSKVLPIDRFRIEDGRLAFEDLFESSRLGEPLHYSIAWQQLDNKAGTTKPLSQPASSLIPFEGGPYRVARITAAQRPGQYVDVALRFPDQSQPPLIVGIDRHW